MPQTIQTVDDLQAYLSGVVERATHHATNVNAIVFALAGAVVLFKDQDTSIQARTYGGPTANVIWVIMNGLRYALAYNHVSGTVEIRRRSVQGEVVASFTNSDSIQRVMRVFNEVRAG